MAWFDVILHARLFFFTDQPWNPWHMLRLKITGLQNM